MPRCRARGQIPTHGPGPTLHNLFKSAQQGAGGPLPLGTAPLHKVRIILDRHSRMVLAGIQV